MTRQLRLAGAVAVAISAAGLTMFAAQAAPVVADAPSCLPKTLSAAQVSAIQSSLIASLQTASGYKHAAPLQSSSLPQQTGGVPVDQVIAQATTNAIMTYGADLAGPITSVIVETAEQQGVPAAVIGKGLAEAAVAEAANGSAAGAIAAALAREGKSGEIASFQTTSQALGHAELAAIAGSPPTLDANQVACAPKPAVAADTGLVHHWHHIIPWFPAGGGAGGEIAGCLNPSCTKL